jgi:hypothetical protein
VLRTLLLRSVWLCPAPICHRSDVVRHAPPHGLALVDQRVVASCQRWSSTGTRSRMAPDLSCNSQKKVAAGVLEKEEQMCRVRVSSLYLYSGGWVFRWAFYMGLAPWPPGGRCLLLASRCGATGIGVEDQRTIPVPAIPDGDSFPTKSIPVGINFATSPSHNGRIPRDESGIGSPLPSLCSSDRHVQG